jgi:hypothetical protein
MPRYFFHVFDGTVLEEDEVGIELSGLIEAVTAAFEAVESLASDENEDHVLHVSDEVGALVSIPFATPWRPAWLDRPQAARIGAGDRRGGNYRLPGLLRLGPMPVAFAKDVRVA